MSKPPYTGDERRAQSWHLAKEVPITLIVTVILQTIAVVWFFADMKKDIELLKADTAVLHKRDDRMALELREVVSALTVQLDRLDGKLDRLTEREKRP